MIITNNKAYRTLLFIFVVIAVGVILTIIAHEKIIADTELSRNKISLQPVVEEEQELKSVPYFAVQRPGVAQVNPDLEGFLPPENPDAPVPARSMRSNDLIENLLYAMMFYGQVSEEDALNSSVLGWDPKTGYYKATKDTAGAEIYSIARHVRHYLSLKYYQKFFPQTKYFDSEASRLERIVDNMIDLEYLGSLFEKHDLFFAIEFPHKIFYDLIELTEITGDPKYQRAAMLIGDKHAFVTVMQANLIKGNKERSDKITMFQDAALTYIYGQRAGKLDFLKDAEMLMEELVEELWDERFGLFYTDSTIGFGDNVTITFITRNQMDALLSLVKYSGASGNMEMKELAAKILISLSDGTNPLCDVTRFGFYRRYAGESRTPREDFKYSLDHITYLHAWVELDHLAEGKYNNRLNFEYERFQNLLYDFTNNAIYAQYSMYWHPEPFIQDVALVSLDAMQDYLLLTLLDRKYRLEQRLGGSS